MSTGEHQGTQQSGESRTDYAAMYKEQHPDAIEDPARAELMARAEDHWQQMAAISDRHAQRFDQEADRLREEGLSISASAVEDKARDERSTAERERGYASERSDKVAKALDEVDRLTR